MFSCNCQGCIRRDYYHQYTMQRGYWVNLLLSHQVFGKGVEEVGVYVEIGEGCFLFTGNKRWIWNSGQGNVNSVPPSLVLLGTSELKSDWLLFYGGCEK